MIWQSWLRSDGLLGVPLTAAAQDERNRVHEVSAAVSLLRDPGYLRSSIKAADKRTKRAEITAGARERLLAWVHEATNVIAAWVEAAHSAAALPDAANPSGIITRLRAAAAQSQTASMLDELDGDEVTIAATKAAAQSVARTLEILQSGTSTAGRESSPAHVLTDDLLLAAGPQVTSTGTRRAASLEELEVALLEDPSAISSWESAYMARTGVKDHEATERIVERISLIDAAAGERFATQRSVDLEKARSGIQNRRRALEDRIASARLLGQLDDADWSAISGAALACDPTGRADLGSIVEALVGLEALIDTAREAAAVLLRERLETARAQLPDRDADLDLVAERADAGDIATAEEYLALVSDGSAIPQLPAAREEFIAWWPALAEELATRPIDGRVLGAIRDGGTIGGLDFSRLDQQARTDAATALQAWTRLSGARPTGPLISAVRPFLPILGIEATDLMNVPSVQSHHDREWRQLIGFLRAGRAMVPDFGSQSSGAAKGNTILVLFVWRSPRASALTSFIAQEPSSRPVIVFYFGALAPSERVALADALRASSHRRPVIVIDDTVMLYAATQLRPDYETIMRLSLPFSAVNPYHSVGGLTPVEMFYGRNTERASLVSLTRSALVYGGRQLGKSSLLRAAERDFDDGAYRKALYIDLKAEGIGTARAATEVWELLWRHFSNLSILAGDPPAAKIAERLQEGLITWLGSRVGRQLLVLLDECDQFFQADAENGLSTVDALDNLMAVTDRRLKFVFAGLHRVQRFKNVENQPLAHLGAPIAVGPLRPPEAMELVVEPVRALGYQFEHEQLPARILAFCNNNPGLIVLFMEALLDQMLGHPLRRPGAKAPPVVITDADVESTYAMGSLAELIKERFELTLDLDPAYKVIAYTVANDAVDHNEGVELSV
jgi:hypothetical protein